MRILVIYAHPSAESLNYSLFEEFLSGAKECGHDVDVVDL